MFVEVTDLGTFDQPAARRSLQQVLLRVREGQHSLGVSDPDGFLETRFFRESVAEADRLEVEELVRRGAAGPALLDRASDPVDLPRVRVRPAGETRVDGRHQWSVPAPAAGDFLDQPLVLVVENRADAMLLWGAHAVYGGARLAEARLRGERWLRVDAAGGSGEVQKRVEGSRPEERMLVLHDRDHDDPVAGPRSEEIERACQDRPWVSGWRLARRETDNYLPARLLAKASGKRKAGYRAWVRLLEGDPERLARLDMAQLFHRDGKTHVQGWLDGGLSKGQGGKRWLSERITELGELRPEDLPAWERVVGDELRRLVERVEEIL